ncbi:hypothetical protein UPYG_G00130630 [Umbra pygmaea]|uniref:DIX domain-containing protein n=1 Tax=Umbra pygmaea TaxID=75934 RepID=A0ABD0XA88_UMBPY
MLERELLRCKQEIRNLQGIKEAQQQRLCALEGCVLQLKQDLLRASMTQDQLTSLNAELQRKLDDRSRLLNECKEELGTKDKLLEQHKHKLENQQEQAGLQRKLECKHNGLVMSRHGDEALPHITGHTYQSPGHFSSCSGAAELQLVRSALRSLRSVFRDQDPQHHTLDTLEQGIASLTDRLAHTHQGGGNSSARSRVTHTQHDSWSPIKMAHSCSSPVQSSSGSTKVLYFTNHSHTPCMVHISKRLGEVTLRDVKTALDRDNNYRFHFKALDPEFGTVKEEVFEDKALVPGWEGKIVAWLEEDLGENRT